MGKSKSPLIISRYNTQKRLKSMKKIKLRKSLKRLFSDYRQDNFR